VASVSVPRPIAPTKPSTTLSSFLALLDDLLPDDVPLPFGWVAADDAPISIPSFCELSHTSANNGSCEVLTNYPIAILFSNTVAKVTQYERGLFINSSSPLFFTS
jgi:hypothetical protein